MYATDVSDRILGMITFSDGDDTLAFNAVKAAGITLHERFNFNNSAMFEYKPDDEVNEIFFNRAMKNYGSFCNYIKTQDKIPVGLPNTHAVLNHRKFIQ